jgi:hypothetical protein
MGGGSMAQHCPHGGQMSVAGPYCFEVVYRPKETRVYLYDSDHRPMSAQGVHGQLLMKMRRNNKEFRFPLKYVAPQRVDPAHDHLAAAVDVSRVRDGDMTVTSELANLPNKEQQRAKFAQTFALSKPPIRVVALDKSDRQPIAQQAACVVTDERLGGMGDPVKVMVGDRPIYLCCKACLGRVKDDPEEYLAKAAKLVEENSIPVPLGP